MKKNKLQQMNYEERGKRIKLEADLKIEGFTVREIASRLKVLGISISKSSVHKDLNEKLLYFYPELEKKVKAALKYNKEQSHIRGGKAMQDKCREKMLKQKIS